MDKFLGKKFEAPKPVHKTEASRRVPPSKQKVKCTNYPGCGFHGVRYSLNRHMQRMHKDECGKVKPLMVRMVYGMVCVMVTKNDMKMILNMPKFIF